MADLRVMAWNVHGFRAGVARVAEVIAEQGPDVAFLNEAGYLGFRASRLGRRLGMGVAGGGGLRHRIPNAVLVRPPWRVVERRVEVLPRSGSELRRGVVLATIGRAGHRLLTVAVHLGLSERERARHAEVLTDLLSGHHQPVVLGGDFNESPDGPAASWIGERYWDAFANVGEADGLTFPSADPRARIDYVFVSAGLRVERAWVAGGADASDHLAVVAEVDLEG
jgi:endonuclease/exonuclease/phosphatase family metal-dependent hydrolase